VERYIGTMGLVQGGVLIEAGEVEDVVVCSLMLVGLSGEWGY
jgi:hypothetical protein